MFLLRWARHIWCRSSLIISARKPMFEDFLNVHGQSVSLFLNNKDNFHFPASLIVIDSITSKLASFKYGAVVWQICPRSVAIVIFFSRSKYGTNGFGSIMANRKCFNIKTAGEISP